jgi:hypothetical protein
MRVRAKFGFLLAPGVIVKKGDVLNLDVGNVITFEGGHRVTLGPNIPPHYYEVLPDPVPQPDPEPSAPPAPPEGGPHEPTHREPNVQNRVARPRRRRAQKEGEG